MVKVQYTALLFFPGVRASETMAGTDLNAVNKYTSLINEAANDLCVKASVIAGLHFSRDRLGFFTRCFTSLIFLQTSLLVISGKIAAFIIGKIGE